MAFGFLGKLFGTDKAVNNLLDKDDGLLVKAGGWVGNLNFTPEEQAEHRLMTRKWGLTQLQALAPFKIVQRILAFGVMAMWVFVGINVVLAFWYDKIKPCGKPAPDMVLVVPNCEPIGPIMLQFAMSDYVFWPVVAVLGLYMCGGVPTPWRKNEEKSDGKG